MNKHPAHNPLFIPPYLKGEQLLEKLKYCGFGDASISAFLHPWQARQDGKSRGKFEILNPKP